MTLGSLFAGVGGFDLGFERAGFKTIWQCEIDKAAQGVLRRHFPDAKLHSDVCQVGAHNLEPVDVVTFGSPCQDLSVAGKRAGLAGGRSGLFHEAARVIRELRDKYGKPDFAIWENVPGAFSSNGGRDFAAVVQTMADIGARDIGWRVLDSRHFGVAQRRRRVFLVADFGGERAEQILFEPESLRGDIAKGRKARKEAPAGIGSGAAGGGREWPARITSTLNAAFGEKMGLEDQHALAGASMFVPTRPIPFDTTQITSPSNYSSPKAGDPRHPLAAGAHPPAVAFAQPIAFHPTQDPISSQDGVSHAMSNGSKAGQATVAVCVTGEVTHALTCTAGKGATEDGTGRGVPQAAHLPNSIFQDSQYGVAEYDSAGSLRAGRIPEHQMVLQAAQAFDRYNSSTSSIYPTLPAGEKAGGFNHVMAYAPAMQVRRLTPTECERLQGFPDGWTTEGVDDRGTVKQQADGPRYKQMGNAVTVNVAEWIARRVAATLAP